MQILDSNIIIASVRENESAHQTAKDIIATGEKNIIFDFIISEVYTVLMMRSSHEKAVKTMDWILENPIFKIVKLSDLEEIETIEFLRENNSKLSYVDAALFVASRKRKIPIQTFDALLKKYADLLE